VLSEQLDNIISHMNATPYMTDPAILRTADATGAQVIGYRDAAQKTEDKELYISFENIFRGSEEMIRNRQRNYLDVLRNHSPVVDLGCGRGEMLDLLKEIGTPAVGVDVDPGMVERVLAKGHSVKRCDAVKYLAEQPDASIGAIFCAQVIEHLEFDHLLKLLRLTIRKLKPDGVFIAETVNPHSHRALKTFWVDLTHNKPIFPEVLVALCRQVGYREAIVRFPVGNGNLDHDRQYEGEYAVIARKMPAKATGKVALRSRSIPRKRKK
jgi:SAM-dependent methyltransferase